jgi:hypothetical protein
VLDAEPPRVKVKSCLLVEPFCTKLGVTVAMSYSSLNQGRWKLETPKAADGVWHEGLKDLLSDELVGVVLGVDVEEEGI